MVQSSVLTAALEAQGLTWWCSSPERRGNSLRVTAANGWPMEDSNPEFPVAGWGMGVAKATSPTPVSQGGGFSTRGGGICTWLRGGAPSTPCCLLHVVISRAPTSLGEDGAEPRPHIKDGQGCVQGSVLAPASIVLSRQCGQPWLSTGDPMVWTESVLLASSSPVSTGGQAADHGKSNRGLFLGHSYDFHWEVKTKWCKLLI